MDSIAIPEDVLHLLCEELGRRHDFDTLFNCACANRTFANPALTHLYRVHQYSPIKGGGDDEYLSGPAKLEIMMKWSVMWRSIIASGLDATLFPYCRYVKTLDFRDLENLLDDDQFKGNVAKYFFSEPLSQFRVTRGPQKRKKVWPLERIDVAATIDNIGEMVTQHTPMLESITGKLLSNALVRWAPRIPRLRALELKDGSPLEDELFHASIYQNCKNFDSLSIYTWATDDRDHKLATFIGGLRCQSLKFFQSIRDIGVSLETYLALSNHSESLKDLRLCLHQESLQHLSLLQPCTALETFRLEDASGSDLESMEDGLFLELVAWLQNCKSLRDLTVTGSQSGAALATPVLWAGGLKLERLEIDRYVLKDHRPFHTALPQLASTLRVLSLSGDTEEMVRDDVDTLVDSLGALKELRELKLLFPEILQDDHYASILANLHHLEELYITGLVFTDAVLSSVATLPKLKSVTFNGLSSFTKAGLVNFISQLGPGNRGLQVMIDMAEPYSLLTEPDLDYVSTLLQEKAVGTLEYTPYRDPEMSEFEGESD